MNEQLAGTEHHISDQQINEQRVSRRRRVLKGANLFFNKGYGAFDCTVKNLSDGGAMIEMEDSTGLPSQFDFVINGESKKRVGSICWRGRGVAGIQFH